VTSKTKGPCLASASPDVFTSVQASSQNLTLSIQGIIDFFSLSSTQVTMMFMDILQQVLDSFSMTSTNLTDSIGGSMNQLSTSFASGQTGMTGYGNTGYYY
jgi:hypothetical protein